MDISGNQIIGKVCSERLSKITPRLFRQIYREIQQPNNSLRKLGCKHSIHHTTIWKLITTSDQPLFAYKVKNKPLLSKLQKYKRIQYCSKYQDADVTKWTFVDEKPFQLCHPPNRQNKRSWRSKNNKHDIEKYPLIKNAKTIHMFAAINFKGKSDIRWYFDEVQGDEKNDI